MTLSEFKAWFEGFTEDMSAAPSEKQWERIKARVGEITGQPVTQTIFMDRYWNYPRPYYGLQNALGNAGISSSTHNHPYGAALQSQGFNSHSAMTALGKAEAKAQAA